MPITAANVKLAKSAVMDDVPEGGGPPVAAVVADAVSNEIFNDISELDRAVGRVNLRKTFVKIDTADRDGYFGGNVIVGAPPQDPLVAVTVFSTRSVFDTRAQAQSRVEAYLNAGPSWPGLLYENHITGQRSMQVLQRTNQAPPTIGRTLLLRQNEGLGTQFEQYVRVTRVEAEVRTFTDEAGDYLAQVITCDLSDALRFDFTGSAANRYFAKAGPAALVRDTVVADAATYFGCVPLVAPVALGAVKCEVASIYTQLVPNSRTETALVDRTPSADYLVTLATTPRQVQVGGSPLSQRIRIGQENRGFNYVTILAPLPAPGSLRIMYRAQGNAYTLVDNGDNTIGGGDAPGSGTVNYLTGSVSVTLAALPDDRSAVVFYWGQNIAYTNRSGQAGFRAPEYAFDLEHDSILPGSFEITWTSGGQVRTAADNGQGKLTGDASGELVYPHGRVFMRPAHMLDAGGEFAIEYQWHTTVEEQITGLGPDATGTIAFSFAQEPVPRSVVLQWLTVRESTVSAGSTESGGATNKSSMAASNAGNTTTTNTVMVETSRAVATGIMYSGGSSSVGQGYSSPHGDTATSGLPWDFDAPPRVGYAPVTTTTSTSTSGSVAENTESGSIYSTSASNTDTKSVSVAHVLTDDGAGGFYGTMGSMSYLAKTASVKVTSDYSSSSYQSNHEQANSFEALNQTGQSTTTDGNATSSSVSAGGGGSVSARGGDYGSTSFKETYGANSLLVRYRTGLASPQAHSETFVPPGVTIDLCPYTRDIVVPGSVRFTWMGQVYEDFEGKLYRGRTEVDPGVLSGSVMYTSGLAHMGAYVVSGSPTAFTLNSLWTRKPREHVANVVFNTEVAPVKPSGLVLSVLDIAGEQMIGTANISGLIDGPHMHGKIDYETGLVEIQFGDYVDFSALTDDDRAEWWYDPLDRRTADNSIWRPWPVDPETLRYNFVSYFYLPLDASVLGIDPVRLPQDGRVPIFRSGSVAVLGHTGTVGPATVANSQVIDCARTRLSRVRIVDVDGVVINTGYSVDLEAGLVTINDITGWAQPVTIEHRIEDMAMVSDVQITGQISFTRQISHDYPEAGSYLSSALIAGDLRARVSLVFDQATWSNVWSDVVSGSAATGTFNAVANPIQVANSGALDERWAVVFNSSTTFNVIGEHVGVIATGNTSADCAPLNPASGTPYFTIPALGWGLGWSTGNVMRFNTVGAYFPVWVVRTIQQGAETVPEDSFTLLIRGDVDRP